MNITADRLLAAGVLFLVTLLVGTVPIYLIRMWTRRRLSKTVIITTNDSRNKTSVLSSNFYIQILTQIGGGVLFFTVFVHMMPEIRENYEKYLATNTSIFTDRNSILKKLEPLKLPYLELAISIGFFGVYLAEVLMHSLLGNHDSSDKLKEEIYDFDKKSVISTVESDTSTGTPVAKDEEPVLIAIRCHKAKCDIDTHEHDLVKTDALYVRALHALVIIFAFSIHSVFDGISIGVKTNTVEIWTMFIAIGSHKLLVALIVGVELYEKCVNFLLFLFNMILFSIMSPIGIITMVITENTMNAEDNEVNPVTIFLSAIASGTILYIVFFEILQKERATKLKPIIQLSSIFVGYILMLLVTTCLREE
ncbi:zinc transporter ZIP3-like [Oppia nitens]|uniref:zinc transporter ZIP3-like n=1 Tax=Oppia nitens TaxID=1686743 RepID=UPI0023DC7780|nr:zinc transporter ZIP3-like [Oppia nitens]XP_054159191.1 zinc transporter ZIP3-like [Oppia nitens]